MTGAIIGGIAMGVGGGVLLGLGLANDKKGPWNKARYAAGLGGILLMCGIATVITAVAGD